MTRSTFSPSPEQIQTTSKKVNLLCQKIDAEIIILDDIIAKIEVDLHASKLYQYRLNKAKSYRNQDYFSLA
ncbi:MAG: hypothetical protein ACRC6M_06540 [Microcystaceae cyanobacterium]